MLDLPDLVEFLGQDKGIWFDLDGDLAEENGGWQGVAMGLAERLYVPVGDVEPEGHLAAHLLEEQIVADVLAVPGLELAFGQAGAVQQAAELLLVHAALDLAVAFAQDLLDLGFIDRDTVFLGFEDQHLFVDHGIEGLLAQTVQFILGGQHTVAHLLEFELHPIIQLRPENDLLVHHGGDAVDEFGTRVRRDGADEAEDEDGEKKAHMRPFFHSRGGHY